jgi:hypothetical protein
MSVHEPSDGIAEEVERHLQLALAGGMLIAQRAAEARRVALSAAQAQGGGAEHLTSQLERERELARARVQAVHDDQWWNGAKPEEIADMSETVEQWRYPTLDGDASDFEAAHERMTQEVRERWGMDLSEVALLAYADDTAIIHDDQQATETNAAAISSPGSGLTNRREQLRERMTASDVPEDAAAARLLVDAAQAQHVATAAMPYQDAEQQTLRSRSHAATRERVRAR